MQKTNKIDMMEAVRIASLSTDYGSKSGSLMKEQKDTNHQPNLTRVHQEDPSNLATAAGNSSSTTRRRPNEVRREKINERMKLLQGLVPGCSKLTAFLCGTELSKHVQVPNAWDEELHDVVQMRCSSTTDLYTHRIQQ
ncbi:hypothetical protein GW17_00030700 [Ensete ventricosum]|nr:hypothetical protein GW17_00030700 [Ensete ventricosum]